MKPLIIQFSPVIYCFPLGLQNFFSALFLKTLSLYSSCNVRDQVLCLYRTYKIIFSHILNNMYLDVKREDTNYWTEM